MRSGLDYVPLDVSLDDKVKLIESEYGLKGFAIIVKLLQKIYGGEGYYCEWTPDVMLLFLREIGEKSDGKTRNIVSGVVDAALRRGFFDKGMFDWYNILTSNGIQKRYFETATKRRWKRIDVRKEYILNFDYVNSDKFDILPEKCNISSEKCNISDTKERKGKERKGKERKDITVREADKPASTQEQSVIELPLNDKSMYGITREQVEHWRELYPAADVMQELRNMSGWLEANPTRRKTRAGILRFITNWLGKTQNKGGMTNGGYAGRNEYGSSKAPEPQTKYGTVLS